MAPSELMERRKNNPHRKAAEQIAEFLFTDGAGRKATRLVMKHPEGDFGAGWSQVAVAHRIAEILLSNNQDQTRSP